MKQTQKTKGALFFIDRNAKSDIDMFCGDFIKGVLANREIAEEWVNTDKELYWRAGRVDTPNWIDSSYELRDPKPKREIAYVAGCNELYGIEVDCTYLGELLAIGRGATSEQEAQEIIRRNNGANIIADAILDVEAEIGETNPEDRACYPVIRAGVWGVGYYEKTVGILLSSSEVIQKICNKLSAGEIKLP